MSEHSPAPWTIAEGGLPGRPACWRIRDATGWLIAELGQDTTKEADARLMAAAPTTAALLADALAALRESRTLLSAPFPDRLRVLAVIKPVLARAAKAGMGGEAPPEAPGGPIAPETGSGPGLVGIVAPGAVPTRKRGKP